MKKTLLFIGFRHKKESIQKARQLGYQTVLLTRKMLPGAKALFDVIYVDNILDPAVLQRLLPELKRFDIRGIVSNYEHYVVPRSYLAEYLGIPSCSVYSACATRNKLIQRNALRLMVENIAYRSVRTFTEAKAAFEALGGDVFVKSIAGIKSRLIFRVRSLRELRAAFKKLKQSADFLDEDLYHDFAFCDFDFVYPDPKRVFLVEKAEVGEQVTVSSFVGTHGIWHAPSLVDIYPASVLGRDDTFLAFRIVPSRYGRSFERAAKRATENASRVLGLQYSSIFSELLVLKEGSVKLIEIASRMGGYRPLMYREAYGFDLNRLLVDAAVGKPFPTSKSFKPKRFVSMVEIFPRERGILKKIVGVAALRKDPKIVSLEVMAKKGDSVGFAKEGHAPVARFLIRGKTYEEVYAKSLRYQETIVVEVE